MRGHVLLALVCLSSSTACVRLKTSHLKTPHAHDRPLIEASDVELELDDQRPAGTSERALAIPALTAPGQGQTIRPALTRRREGLISREIERHLADAEPAGPRALLVRVTLLAAEAEWQASFWSESELARARIAIEVQDLRTGRTLAKSVGDASGEVTDLDSDARSLLQLFDLVLVHAVHRAFEEDFVRRVNAEDLSVPTSTTARVNAARGGILGG